MSAQSFSVLTIVLPNPRRDSNQNARIVNDSYGFTLRGSNVIRTLSPNNPNNFDIVRGLLYVPDVRGVESCADFEGFIPSNVTRITDFPTENYNFVALAPWNNELCTQEYLTQMRADAVRGAIFFQLDGGSERPPPISDPIWSLRDGGSWRRDNQFPVYAIPGAFGFNLLDELARYSGNMSSAPYGAVLADLYDPDDLIRLYTRIDVNGTAGIPSLWVFLIIVLAILLAIVLLTSVVMHIIQRRQRILLQRRVANGEVDLEALGIKRLNVPQEVLDKMPQYVFTSKTEGTAAVDLNKAAIREVPFSQPTCPICLDDFVHGETTIRELPCNHIFHPECIDPFLRDNSSLCPMCKKSALPPGFCPVHVTNLMVRRERLIRRMRARAAMQGQPQPPPGRFAQISSFARRVRGMSTSTPSTAADANANVENNATEMRPQRRSTVFSSEPVPPEVQSEGRSAIRAWRRQQLANRQTQRYNEQADQTRAVDVSRPRWRRIVGRVFPSLE